MAVVEVLRRLCSGDFARLWELASQDKTGWTWLLPATDEPYGIWEVTASSRCLIAETPTGPWECLQARVLYLAPDLEYMPWEDLLFYTAAVLARILLGFEATAEEIHKQAAVGWGFFPGKAEKPVVGEVRVH